MNLLVCYFALDDERTQFFFFLEVFHFERIHLGKSSMRFGGGSSLSAMEQVMFLGMLRVFVRGD